MISHRSKILRWVTGILFIIAIILLAKIATATTTNTNDPAYWEAQFPGSVCTKTDTLPAGYPWPGSVAVIVKGGPNGTFIVYTPPYPPESDLVAPINPNNERPYGTSHVILCDAQSSTTTTPGSSPTTPPTSSPSSSTTSTTLAQSTTSVTSPTTTTSPRVTTTSPTTSTSPPSVSVTSAPTTSLTVTTVPSPTSTTASVMGEETSSQTQTTLPFTGSTLPASPLAILAIAGVLLVGGFVLVRWVDVQ